MNARTRSVRKRVDITYTNAASAAASAPEPSAALLAIPGALALADGLIRRQRYRVGR